MTLYAFDGTWNKDQEGEKGIQDTNVVRFKELYLGNNTEYLEGIGTRFGKIGAIFGGVFGSGGRQRINEMYEELCENWRNGDKIIDIIGFSRGAALAIHFANKIGDEGIIITEKGKTEKATIRFLGVWEIVGSFGLSFDTFIDFQDINLGWRIDTVHESVENCSHAMALDERRETFGVERLNPENKDSKVKEVCFRGVHSDIGGGNENVARSNFALQWMLEQARKAGLTFNETKAKLPRYSETDIFAPISENTDVKIDERRNNLDNAERHSSADPFYLKVGKTHTCRVYAGPKFNWSGVTLRPGEKYSFSVPSDAIWQDKGMKCGPKGWETEELPMYKEMFVREYEQYRRMPDANWFALIGAEGDEDKNLFLIGDCTIEYTVTATAEFDLYLFANDVPSKYDNNLGSFLVTIKRIH